MSFAEMIRSLRIGAGLTQKGLAERSGISIWVIRSYETGNREPGWRTLLDLCRAFDIDPRIFDRCVPGGPIPTLQGRPKKAEAAQGEPAAAKGKGKRK